VSMTELRAAAEETRRLADLLEALGSLSARQAELPADDGEAWLALQGRKQSLYDGLAALSLPELFLRARDLTRPHQGDDEETAAARRRLAPAAAAAIRQMEEIAASELEAKRRLAGGLHRLKEKATAARRCSQLHHAYAAPPSPPPRFLDARE